MADIPRPGQQTEQPPELPEKGLYGPNAVFPTWIVFGVFSILIGIATFILSSMMLSAQSVLPCSMFKIIGGLFLPIGFFVAAGGALALRFRALQDTSELEEPIGSRIRRYVCMFFGVLFFGIMIFVCVVAASLWIMSRSVPNTTEDVTDITGISGEVRITRDVHGIPHIKANDIYDAYFGQGFVHAQDRLFQIELIRLVGAGRLAEHVGEPGLEVDKATRAMRIGYYASKLCQNADPETLRLINSYANGINEFLIQDGTRPPEFMFMNKRGTMFVHHEPELWVANDVCIVAKILQFNIMTNHGPEMRRWKLFSEAGFTHDDLEDLFNDFRNVSSILDPDVFNITEADAAAARARDDESRRLEKFLYDTEMWRFRDNETLATGANVGTPRSARRRRQSGARLAPAIQELVDSIMDPPETAGSNAWATRRANTPPITMSDPHLAITVPPVWHYSHLQYPINGSWYDASGVVMPGLPGVLIGKTTNVAWGITMAITDLADFYVMQPDPARPSTHYMYHGQSIPFEIRAETMKIAGGGSETKNFYTTVLGPVVGVELEITSGHYLVLNSSMFNVNDGSMDAVVFLSHPTTKTVQDVIQQLSKIEAPGLSISISDHLGTIGYAITGKYVIRAPGHTGRMPVLGNGSYDIQGYVPYAELPTLVNTDNTTDGWVGCANQKIYPDGYKYNLGWDWHWNFRGDYLKARLGQATSAELADLQWHRNLQMSTYSNLFDQVFAPQLLNNATFRATFTPLLSAGGSQWLTRLSTWDRNASFGSQEATFFWEWLTEVAKLPRKACAVMEYFTWQPNYIPARILFNPSDGHLRMCASENGDATPTADSCLRYATNVWNRIAGKNIRKWGYEVNRQRIPHLVFTKTILECVFDRETHKDGDRTSLNVAGSSDSKNDEELPTYHAASNRQQYDWSTPNTVYFSLPGGNSGNPWSRFYMNLLDTWRDGGYAAVGYFDHTGDTMLLKPKK